MVDYFQETALKKNILRTEKETAQLQQSIIKLRDQNIKTLRGFTSAIKKIESKNG
jgi:hypothetical protein